MITFVLNVLLFFCVYQIGKAAGRVEEKMKLTIAINKGTALYNKVIKLAELKGEDTSKLTPQEIATRIEKLERDTKDEGSIY